MKIVINTCYGGFNLSDAAILAYAERKGIKLYKQESGFSNHFHYFTTPDFADGSYWSDDNIERNDPDLVGVVEDLGPAADGLVSQLKIVEVPDGTDFVIEEYDGNEWVSERHQTWR